MCAPTYWYTVSHFPFHFSSETDDRQLLEDKETPNGVA